MKSLYLSLILLGMSYAACSQKSKVKRVDANTTIDLSGRWNDVDSRQTSEELAKQILEGKWIWDYTLEKEKEPIMIVGIIRNKSHEHIEAEAFIKDIEKELIKSRKVRLVQNSQLRDKLRKERTEQEDFASEDTQKKFGKELGADYMLFGTINSIVDQEKRKKVIYYQINLELANIETNELVWVGDKKIKKYVK